MSDAGGTRWVPTGNGGMILQTAGGTVLLTVSSTGAVTYGAAVTTVAVTIQSMTSTQRDAVTPAAGMLIYNSSTGKLNVYTTGWEAVTSA